MDMIKQTIRINDQLYSTYLNILKVLFQVESDRSSNNGDSGGRRGINRLGVYDYNQKKFIMPDGRLVYFVIVKKFQHEQNKITVEF